MNPAVTALITMFVVALVPLAPTEPVLIGMGVLASTGHVPLVGVIAVASVGCCISDHLLYAVGRLGGARVLARLNRKPAVAAATDWLHRHVTRWGTPILIAGRWLPGGGTVGAIMVGTMRWRLARFTPCSAAGSTLWSIYVALLGYVGGALTGQPVIGLVASLAMALLVGLTSSVVVQRASRRAATLAPVHAES